MMCEERKWFNRQHARKVLYAESWQCSEPPGYGSERHPYACLITSPVGHVQLTSLRVALSGAQRRSGQVELWSKKGSTAHKKLTSYELF